MARKDNKGRNLKTGESQRPDGRYMYCYKDELTGKRVTIYDMDLASLREQEKKINKDIAGRPRELRKEKYECEHRTAWCENHDRDEGDACQRGCSWDRGVLSLWQKNVF